MRKWFLFSATLTVLMACDGNRPADWSGWPQSEAFGLRFAVPPGYMVGERGLDGGVFVLSTDRDRRIIDTIELFIERRPPERRLGERIAIREGIEPAPYVVYEAGSGSGSGGTEFALMTEKRIDDRTIYLLAFKQREGIVPVFPEAFAVWDSLRLATN